jgi:hypothetical protein
VAVLNCGDRRSTSKVERSVQAPNGQWQVQEFDVWCPVAFSGIDELPPTLQDRSVCIPLRKVLAKEVPEHLRDGSSPELVDLRRQFAKWGRDLTELPEPDMPAVLLRQAGRLGDNWRPLIAIADLAGGQWPDLIRAAALEAVAAEAQPTELERLLASIKAAFAAQAAADDVIPEDQKIPEHKMPDNRYRLQTSTLLKYLLDDQNEDWNRAHQGRQITAYYLRKAFRGLLTPPGAQDWWTGLAGQQTHHSGYLRHQFEGVWATYLRDRPEDQAATAREADLSSAYTHSPQSSASGEAGEVFDFIEPLSGDDTPAANSLDASGDWENAANYAPDENLGNPPPLRDSLDSPDVQERVFGEEKVEGNGLDQDADSRRKRGRPPSELTRLIRADAEAHPDWPVKRLAKRLGQPASVVDRALNGRHPPAGDAS